MARENTWDRPTIINPPVQPVTEEPRVRMPHEPIPSEVKEWLGKMGWVGQSDGDGNELFHKANSWDDLYYSWSEAVALEHLKFMSLGSVGEKQVQTSLRVSRWLTAAAPGPAGT